jgi:two-component system sensor histidine kinase KdpD
MTKYWPELDRWYTPLPGNETALGVAAVAAPSQVTPGMEEDLRHLEAIARQIGLALQREQLARQAQAAALEARTESMRNALLASISHDLRTPLAAIVGSATTLSGQREQLSESQQSELLRNIEDEAMQMTAVAENILQLARLSAEETRLRRDWASIGEIIGTVVGRQRRRGEQRVMARLVVGNARPVAIVVVRHAAETVHRVPRQFDRIELDVRNGMDQRRPALRRAQPALRELAR